MPEQITLAGALKLVKTIAADRYKADAKMAETHRQEAEKKVGGQVTEFDASVIAQGRQWMQRLAFIARSLDQAAGSTSYQSTSKSGDKLRKMIPDIAAIIAQLEALQLTDPQIGLFREPNKRDYEIAEWKIRGVSVGKDDDQMQIGDDASEIIDVLEIGNQDLADQIEDALKGKKLVAEPPKQTALAAGKPAKKPRGKRAETPVAGVAAAPEEYPEAEYSEDPDASDHIE